MCLCTLVSCFGLDLSGGKLNFPALLDIAIHHTLRHSTTLPGGLNAQLRPVLILIIDVIQLHSLHASAQDRRTELSAHLLPERQFPSPSIPLG